MWRAASQLGIGPEAADTRHRGRAVVVRHPGEISSSAGPLGGLSFGSASRQAGGAPRARRSHRRATWTPTGAPGIAPTRPRAPMRTSPQNSTARPSEPRPAAESARQRHSSNAPRALTVDPAQRGERALAAASAKVQAGAFDAALDLLAMAEAEHLSDLQQARADLVRAQLAFVTSRGSDAPPLLVEGRPAARIDRHRPVARHLHGCDAGRDVRRPPGRRRATSSTSPVPRGGTASPSDPRGRRICCSTG